MVEGRDFFVDELLKDYHGARVEPVSMPAEAPLFLMYTSGTTGKPKGCQHSTGGYLAYVTGTSKYYQDIHPEDIYWCMADIGWITGHSYIVYGPLALGTTTVDLRGRADLSRTPAGLADRRASSDVNIFHTAPTTIRMLRKLGPDEPAKYNYHFKHMTTVGEPIEPEVWRWYYDVVGKGEAVIVDTWWQTENGGFLCSTLPGAQADEARQRRARACPASTPSSTTRTATWSPPGAGRAGNICIRNPWPGIFQTIWGDRERFVRTYYERYCKNPKSKDWRDWPYFAGDGAVQAADGYFRILGRVDDVINVAGHRLGHQGDRVRGADGRGGRRGRGGARWSTRSRAASRSSTSRSSPASTPARRSRRRSRTPSRREIGKIARPAERLDRPGHAQDPLRQDHAPGAGGDLEHRRCRRRHHAGQPRDRRGHPENGRLIYSPGRFSMNEAECARFGERR